MSRDQLYQFRVKQLVKTEVRLGVQLIGFRNTSLVNTGINNLVRWRVHSGDWNP